MTLLSAGTVICVLTSWGDVGSTYIGGPRLRRDWPWQSVAGQTASKIVDWTGRCGARHALSADSQEACRTIDLHLDDLGHEACSRWLEQVVPLHHVPDRRLCAGRKRR